MKNKKILIGLFVFLYSFSAVADCGKNYYDEYLKFKKFKLKTTMETSTIAAVGTLSYFLTILGEDGGDKAIDDLKTYGWIAATAAVATGLTIDIQQKITAHQHRFIAVLLGQSDPKLSKELSLEAFKEEVLKKKIIHKHLNSISKEKGKAAYEEEIKKLKADVDGVLAKGNEDLSLCTPKVLKMGKFKEAVAYKLLGLEMPVKTKKKN